MDKMLTRGFTHPFYVNEKVVRTFTTVINVPNSKGLDLLPCLAKGYRVGFGVIAKQESPGKSYEAIVNDAATVRIDGAELTEGVEIYAGCIPGYTNRVVLYDEDLAYLQQAAGVVYGN